jgi:hypothetical protein
MVSKIKNLSVVKEYLQNCRLPCVVVLLSTEFISVAVAGIKY